MTKRNVWVIDIRHRTQQRAYENIVEEDDDDSSDEELEARGPGDETWARLDAWAKNSEGVYGDTYMFPGDGGIGKKLKFQDVRKEEVLATDMIFVWEGAHFAGVMPKEMLAETKALGAVAKLYQPKRARR